MAGEDKSILELVKYFKGIQDNSAKTLTEIQKLNKYLQGGMKEHLEGVQKSVKTAVEQTARITKTKTQKSKKNNSHMNVSSDLSSAEDEANLLKLQESQMALVDDEIDLLEKKEEVLKVEDEQLDKEQKQQKKEETQKKKDKVGKKKAELVEKKKESSKAKLIEDSNSGFISASSEIKTNIEKTTSLLSSWGKYAGGLFGLDKLFSLKSIIVSQFEENFGWLEKIFTFAFTTLKTFGGLLTSILFLPFKLMGGKKNGMTTTTTANVNRPVGSGGASNDGSAVQANKEKQDTLQKELELQHFQSQVLGYLEKIAGYLEPKKEMIKGGVHDLDKLLDWFKKLPVIGKLFGKKSPKGSIGVGPAGRAGEVAPRVGVTAPIPIGGMKGAGGMMAKAGGIALIAGGIMWVIKDFMDGFKEGGMGSGIQQALLGKMSGSLLESVAGNMGKYALIGAGIGLLGGPAGVIGGALLGAGIGYIANMIGRIGGADASAGTKIADFLLGGTGLLGLLGSAGKWAMMGALVGSVVPGAGTIAGAIVGAGVGILVNFIKQILPGDVVGTVGRALDTFGGWISDAWSWFVSTVSGVFKGWWDNIVASWEEFKTDIGFAWDLVKGIFSSILNAADWIAEKLGLKEYWDKFKRAVKEKWTIVTDFWGKIFGGIGEFFGKIWDSFKTVMGDYWDRIKAIFGVKGKLSDIVDETPKPTPQSNTMEEKEKTLNDMKSNANLEQIGDKLADANSFAKKTAEQQKTIEKESKGFWDKFAKSIDNKFDDLTMFFHKQQQEKQMREYYEKTGSLKGYSDKYKGFERELQRFSKTAEAKQVKESQKNVQTNLNQTTINNSDFKAVLKQPL